MELSWREKVGNGLAMVSPLPILYVLIGFLVEDLPGQLFVFLAAVFFPLLGRIGLRLSRTTNRYITACPIFASVGLTIALLLYLFQRRG